MLMPPAVVIKGVKGHNLGTRGRLVSTEMLNPVGHAGLLAP